MQDFHKTFASEIWNSDHILRMKCVLLLIFWYFQKLMSNLLQHVTIDQYRHRFAEKKKDTKKKKLSYILKIIHSNPLLYLINHNIYFCRHKCRPEKVHCPTLHFEIQISTRKLNHHISDSRYEWKGDRIAKQLSSQSKQTVNVKRRLRCMSGARATRNTSDRWFSNPNRRDRWSLTRRMLGMQHLGWSADILPNCGYRRGDDRIPEVDERILSENGVLSFKRLCPDICNEFHYISCCVSRIWICSVVKRESEREITKEEGPHKR